MTLSKNKIKQINALSIKKIRDEKHVFVAEGTKLVLELTTKFIPETIVATPEWLNEYKITAEEIICVPQDEIKKISQLKSTPPVVAVFKQTTNSYTITDIIRDKQLILILDTVQDPGNLGTIIRIADWFGIRHIFCSLETADVYNSKVIQSTMGALSRVAIHYTDLTELLGNLNSNKWPIYGTFLNGKSIYQAELTEFGAIVMGNEGKGISPNLEQYIQNKILIPSYPTDADTVESLNVAVATAITCAEFRRRV